jgi:hypothetical protein
LSIAGSLGVSAAIYRASTDTIFILVGAMVLEALDLLVDGQNQCVVPRDPSGPIYEIE